MKKILVLCTGNSCRSQMAEGYLRHFAGIQAQVFSAGIEAHGVNPLAIQVMSEDGIDITEHTSKTIDVYDQMAFDIVLTVCDHAKEVCPFFPSVELSIHHDFPDPAKASGSPEQVLDAFRQVRQVIKDFCRQFVEQYLTTD